MLGKVDDIWSEARLEADNKIYVDLMVSPQNFNYLKDKAKNMGWDILLITNNVQNLIEESITTVSGWDVLRRNSVIEEDTNNNRKGINC